MIIFTVWLKLQTDLQKHNIYSYLSIIWSFRLIDLNVEFTEWGYCYIEKKLFSQISCYLHVLTVFVIEYVFYVFSMTRSFYKINIYHYHLWILMLYVKFCLNSLRLSYVIDCVKKVHNKKIHVTFLCRYRVPVRKYLK